MRSDRLAQALMSGGAPADLRLERSGQRWHIALGGESIISAPTPGRALVELGKRIERDTAGMHVWAGDECERCGARRGWPIARDACPRPATGY